MEATLHLMPELNGPEMLNLEERGTLVSRVISQAASYNPNSGTYNPTYKAPGSSKNTTPPPPPTPNPNPQTLSHRSQKGSTLWLKAPSFG